MTTAQEAVVSSADAPRRGSRHRTRWLVVTAGLCATSTVLGLLASQVLRSPWESAAAHSRANVVATAPVDVHTFKPVDVEAHGRASLGAIVDVRPGITGTSMAVVTAARKVAGATVRSGEEIVEVSGRPIIALKLPFDLYRDIVPGDSGTDVRALQGALSALGLYDGPSDGEYGAGTAAAVRALYARVDAPSPPPDSASEAAAATAQQAVAQAAIGSSGGSGAHDGDQGELPMLRAGLAAARAAADTPVRMAEILALRSDRTVVASIEPVGSHLDGDHPVVARLRSGLPSATVRVGVADRVSFAAGSVVEVVAASDQTTTVRATVTATSGFKQADDAHDVPGYDVTLAFSDVRELPFADGDSVIARVPSSDQPISGLAVPIVAVREDRTGNFVLLDGPTPRRVGVELGVAADGYVLVTGDVAVGERVVVAGEP